MVFLELYSPALWLAVEESIASKEVAALLFGCSAIVVIPAALLDPGVVADVVVKGAAVVEGVVVMGAAVVEGVGVIVVVVLLGVVMVVVLLGAMVVIIVVVPLLLGVVVIGVSVVDTFAGGFTAT